MNVPWVDPCAFSPSWQLARRKVRQNQACTEHNPSDWQLCPLVTVWLSPKLLYFTEIMIFYGHRFEDNCCILRVVVLQGDTAASFGEEMWGEKSSSLFPPHSSPPHFPFPHLSFFYLFLIFIYLFAFLVAKKSPITSHCPSVFWWCSATDIPALSPATSHGDNKILQWSMKEQTFRSREIWKGEGGRASEGILCTWLLFIAAWWLAVLMARYVGPQGVVKNHHGPGKGINARGSGGGDGFQSRPGADVQTAQHLPRFTSLTLAPVDGFSFEF